MEQLSSDKKKLGELSQAHVIARLLEKGYNILLPYGDRCSPRRTIRKREYI